MIFSFCFVHAKVFGTDDGERTAFCGFIWGANNLHPTFLVTYSYSFLLKNKEHYNKYCITPIPHY